MLSESPNSDYANPPYGMTPEANSDVSRAHLLKWAMDHRHVHFTDGIMEVDNDDDTSDDTPPSRPSRASLLALQAKITLEEAGQPLRLLPTDTPDQSEAL